MDWTLRGADLAIVFATLAGPVLAVWASEWRQRRRSEDDRREWIFRTLLLGRGLPFNPDQVAAINLIPLAFPESKYPSVIDSQQLYVRHLQAPPSPANESSGRGDDLFLDLLVALATAIGLKFRKADLRVRAYRPDRFAASEVKAAQVQDLLLQLLEQRRALHVKVDDKKPPGPRQDAM